MILGVLLYAPVIGVAAEPHDFWIEPDFKVAKAIWPKDANGLPVFGSVRLDCAVGPTGFAVDCTAVSPGADARLVDAALKLAPRYKARTASSGRAPLDVEMLFDSEPDWLKKPSLPDLMAAYPAEAARNGKDGAATISCWVKTDGFLRSCRVVSEDPPGYGFGGAALVLQTTFLMKPAMRGGKPVEAVVRIPIHFSGGDAFAGAETVTVFGSTVWAMTPGVPEIQALIDKKVGDRFAEGKVVLQCKVDKKSGRLTGCIMVNSSPGMAQFQGVARALTPRFAVAPAALAGIKNDVKVNLAFSFPDMASAVWGKRYLAKPQWIRTVNDAPAQAVFPTEAAKAGLKSGSATVDCIVGPDGGLTACETVSESTPGMGFGAMAQSIARTFALNPWTEDGLPAEGAHVRMPIKMVDSDAQAAPAKPAG